MNPWSKKSTIDWGNSSLPVEDFSSTPVWSTGIETENHVVSSEVTSHVTNDVPNTEQSNGWAEPPQVEMKDQTTVSGFCVV